MNDFDAIAFLELGVLVLSAWDDLLIALDSHQGVGETERNQQRPDRRARLNFPLFSVDHELHQR